MFIAFICWNLEIDGAFKYVGENMELNCKSLVVIFTENLNNKKNLEKYKSNKEKKEIIYKWDKYNGQIEKLKNHLKKYKLFDGIDFNKDELEKKIIQFKNEIKKDEIILNNKIIINKNDLLLIENKREFPKNLKDEVENFIIHSLYFIYIKI